MGIKDISKFIIPIIICEFAGIAGLFFTSSAIPAWYENLIKPTVNPPAWIFGPVWTLLYFLMGVSVGLIWISDTRNSKKLKALVIFIVQLALNAFWSLIFFGLHNPFIALIELIFLWLAILVTIVAFSKISKPAAWLLSPYILWVSFAGYLNYSIWILNKNEIKSGITCTQEAKQCSNGSYVGRTGPNCEFTSCPPAINTADWKIFNDSQKGISFKYPEKLATEYIYTIDWPPQVQVLNNPFTCTGAGSETARAGQTQMEIINGTEYCITKETQGAAGSIYTMYAYAVSEANKTVILTFSLRFSQCANYENPQQTKCLVERETFNIDPIIDQISKNLIIK